MGDGGRHPQNGSQLPGKIDHHSVLLGLHPEHTEARVGLTRVREDEPSVLPDQGSI